MFRLQRFVYLDNNATTVVSRRVRREMDRVLRRHHGNPSARYGMARSAARILQDARESVAEALNAEPGEICFTSGATEANNQVLKALVDCSPDRRPHVLTTPIEHPSIMRSLEALQARGARVEAMPIEASGRLRLERLDDLIDDDTALICCMLANNEIGTIQEVETLAAIARRRGVPLLCDCVQALGKIPVDVKALGVDYASFSAHKLHGPKGVGALYVRSGVELAPLLHGGHQEGDRRAGTEGLHNIAGFAEACRAVPALLARANRVRERRQTLLDELRRIRPDLVVHSPEQHCLPNTLSVGFPGVSAATLMAALDMHGVAVSLGSACSAGETVPSHVLRAIGLDDAQASEAIRISLSDRTTMRELRHAVRAFREFLGGRTPAIPLLRPSQVGESFVDDPDNYLLDVRFDVERRLVKGLPNSHEASVIAFERYVHHVPRDRNVVVVCSTGIDATPIAYALHKRGYRRVAVLVGGVLAWRVQHPELARRRAAQNALRLAPRRR